MFSKQTFLVLLLIFTTVAYSQSQTDKIIGQAEEIGIKAKDVQYNQEKSLVVAKGDVAITYGNLVLTSNEASINQANHDFTATGNVIIKTKGAIGQWSAPYVKGNLDRRQYEFGPYRLVSETWFGAGEGGSSAGDGQSTLGDAWLSTCDLEHPHYCLAAKSITYNDDKTFKAKHVFFKLWDVPVFYFPYLWGTTDNSSGFIIKPGYSSKRGLYLRLGYGWSYAKDVKQNAYVDLMTKNGVGVGSDLEAKLPNGSLKLNAYGIKDQDAPETTHGYNRRFDYEDERYRVHLSAQERLTDRLTLRVNVDKLSDIDMLEDWFKRDYRHDYQPKSYADLTYEGELLSSSLNVRPRINDFYTVVETLPEFNLNIHRVDVGSTPFQYESLSKAGYYSMKWRNFDRSRLDCLLDQYDEDLHDDPHDYQSSRFHTQHFLYLPMDLWDALVLTPRAGAAITYYGKSSKTKITQQDLNAMFEADDSDNPYSLAAVKHYDSDGGDVTRLALEFGAELKTSFYSDWMDFRNSSLDINGMQHVLEPYVNYTYAPDPSHDRDHLYYFDDLDRLCKQHFIRLGLDQRFLTKNPEKTRSFIRMQSYMDFHFDRDEETDSHPGDLGNRIDFYPFERLSTWAALVHDVGDGEIQRGETGIKYTTEDELSLALRYIYRNDHCSRTTWSLGSTLVDLAGESSYMKKNFEAAEVIVADLVVPLNPITKLAITAEYDFEENKLSEHRYELRRRLHCWDMALGVGWDNYDFETYVMFQLVAFPNVKLDLTM